MACYDFASLRPHVGHKVEVVVYGNEENVAIECMDCMEVLIDFNKEEDESEEK